MTVWLLPLRDFRWRCFWFAISLTPGLCQVAPTAAQVQKARISADALRAMKTLQVPPGFEVQLYAAEPLLTNPVAMHFDERGRCFVCETYRQRHGVEDNRDHEDWVDDDLASQSVDDRLAMFRKHLGEAVETYQEFSERIRLLTDRNSDGRADRSVVFAGGFNDILDGTGAGILSIRGNVYYACIPKLWAFRDDDGDGQADRRAALLDGFGVRVAFRGHDLHGLCLGPDGRIYFSIGDRGYHVETDDGVIADAESGAIFRCDQDGSGLEVIATGLRNPQELAFDDTGHLFTADNNSDSSDLARWVHVLEGMDAGWRMAYQYLPDRGPWNRETMWQPYHAGQPAFIYPPIANICDGPAGVAYYPGTGMSDAYVGNFFVCDFRGTPALSGVRTFKVQPAGASFQLIDPEVMVWGCLATDVDFGPRGGFYVLDWVEGWTGSGKGRIYRVFESDQRIAEEAQQVDEILKGGTRDEKLSPLMDWLEHPDRRVRMAAQMELTRRQAVKALTRVIAKSQLQLARLHAVWGLGQIARVGTAEAREAARKALRPLLRDVDPEIRANTCRVLGDALDRETVEVIVAAIHDPAPQVRAVAAIACGKLRTPRAVPPLIRLMLSNAGDDPALRHSAVMGLAGCASQKQLATLSRHPSSEVRLGAVVALRRQASPRISRFLKDESEFVATEAARAIYDVPIPAALPALAAQVRSDWTAEPLLARAMVAAFRLGQQEHAQLLGQAASDPRRPLPMRRLALSLLGMWDHPPARDPLLGMWRPVETADRNGMHAVEVVRDCLPVLLESGQELRMAVAQLAARFNLEEAGEALRDLMADAQRSGAERAGALLSLAATDPDDLRQIADAAISDSEERVRAAGRLILARLDPAAAVTSILTVLREGTTLEQQSALVALVAAAVPEADALLAEQMQQLLDGSAPVEIRLDIYHAAQRRSADSEPLATLGDAYRESLDPNDASAPHRIALFGGDANRGERIFFDRLDVACARCHQVNGRGGKVGPDLSDVGERLDREQLLESLVQPNAAIAKGFESVIVNTKLGTAVSGIIQEKNEQQLTLIQSDATTVTIPRAEIDSTDHGPSAMPADVIQYLSPFDLRDLIEYLATRKK